MKDGEKAKEADKANKPVHPQVDIVQYLPHLSSHLLILCM